MLQGSVGLASIKLLPGAQKRRDEQTARAAQKVE